MTTAAISIATPTVHHQRRNPMLDTSEQFLHGDVKKMIADINTAQANIEAQLLTVAKLIGHPSSAEASAAVDEQTPDLSLTIEQLRAQVGKLEGYKSAVDEKIQNLTLERLCKHCCCKAERITEGFYRFAGTISFVAGGGSLAADLFRSTHESSDGLKIAAFVLVACGAVFEKLKGMVETRIRTYEVNLHKLESAFEKAARLAESTEALTRLLERVNRVVVKKQPITAKDVPEQWRGLVDPMKLNALRQRFKTAPSSTSAHARSKSEFARLAMTPKPASGSEEVVFVPLEQEAAETKKE